MCFVVFLVPSGNAKNQEMNPKGNQNGAQKEGNTGLLSDQSDMSWICYLLYLSHMGLPRGGPGRQSKSDPDSEPCPEQLFDDLGRIWGSIWNTFFGKCCGTFGDLILEQILEWILGS